MWMTTKLSFVVSNTCCIYVKIQMYLYNPILRGVIAKFDTLITFIKLLILKVYLFRSTILITLCTLLLCVSFLLCLKSEHQFNTLASIMHALAHACTHARTHTHTHTHTHRGMHAHTGLHYWFESTLPHQNMKRLASVPALSCRCIHGLTYLDCYTS